MAVVLKTLRFLLLSPVYLLVSSIVLIPVAQAQSTTPDLCVLVYERSPHPIAQVVSDFYRHVPNSKIVVEAKPLDLLACIEGGYREILMVAHGFWRSDLASEDPVFQLGYFNRVQAEKQGSLLYEPKLFLNRVFELAYQKLKTEKEQTGKTRLQKFRFAACGIDSLRVTHPFLTRLIQDFVNSYDEAPVASGLLVQLLTGDTPGVKRAIDKEWLTKSSRCEKATRWRTDKNSRCEKDWWGGCDRKTAIECNPLAF